MKVSYNKKSDIYCIDLEYPETEIYIKAGEITKVKDMFVTHMSWLFEETIREQLKN